MCFKWGFFDYHYAGDVAGKVFIFNPSGADTEYSGITDQ